MHYSVFQDVEVRGANQHIREALQLARELTILADETDADAEDEGCCILAGVVRDCAYKLRNQAERERREHQEAGTWQTPADSRKRE